MVIYGRHPVREALRAGVKPYEILVAEGAHLPKELKDAIFERGIKVRLIKRSTLTQITGSNEHQGIAADIGEFKTLKLKEVLNIAFKSRGILLGLDHIQDPRNAGSLIRTAEAFGVAGVVMTVHRTVSITPALIKASSGACFHLPIAIGNLRQFAIRFKDLGGMVAALDMSGDDIRHAKPKLPLLLIVGAEGPGVSASILEVADEVWRIPQVGKVEALNAAVAGAIAMWEVWSKVDFQAGSHRFATSLSQEVDGDVSQLESGSDRHPRRH
jgi:23S rRNA (guanosine2251-2'-O)-methyltransferase